MAQVSTLCAVRGEATRSCIEVLHAVPLENEGFTVAKQDGRVEVYFTRQGQRPIESMLREAAL